MPSLRQKRALRKAIDGLVMEKMVENIEIQGTARVRCIRLMKYNPDGRVSGTAAATNSVQASDLTVGQEAMRVIDSEYPCHAAVGGLIEVSQRFCGALPQIIERGRCQCPAVASPA